MKTISILFVAVVAFSFSCFSQTTVIRGNGYVEKFRAGSYITVDPGFKIVDEDGLWTNTHAQLHRLAKLQAGQVTNVNYFTNIITFTTAYTAAPVVILTGDATNSPPWVISVTASNAAVSGCATNSVIRWFSMRAN